MMKTPRITACFDEEDDDLTTKPTWIMGIPYTELKEEERRLDVFSTMWMTYRSGFPRMDPYGYTDDSGWGCMLRSAQMLMTQALQRHTLGRSWRVPRTLEERLRVQEYRALVQLFADHPGEESLFSIHNMCQVGIRYDKLPGEWYGPTTAACVLRDISELFAARLSPPPRTKSQGSRYTARQPLSASLNKRKPVQDGSLGSKSAGVDKHLGGASSAPLEDAPPSKLEKNQNAEQLYNTSAIGKGKEGADGDRNEGEGGDDGTSKNIVFPSSGPLRVFVSQGDVVYIDEVEAMAVRGGGSVAAGGEIENLEANGSSRPSTATEYESSSRSHGISGGSSSPAFFDPLLNPGVEGDRRQEQEAWSSAVVLLVPLRLGLDEMSTGYVPSLLEMLRVPQSLGFLGGRPNHAIFYIGAQGNTLIGLDPHTTQAAPEMGASFPTERYLHSLHCQSSVSTDVHRIDPSLALAFYLPDRASFNDLAKKIGQTNPPPFSVEQTRPDYEGEMGLAFMINQRDEDGTTDDDDDDYVFVKGPER